MPSFRHFAYGLILILATQALSAQGLELHLDASVKNADNPQKQISLVPTHFEIFRAFVPQSDPTPVTFRDPNVLVDPFIRVHGPTALYVNSKLEEGQNPNLNPKIENFSKMIENLNVDIAPTDLVLRGTGFNVFNSWNPLQTSILVTELCKITRPKRIAQCNLEFPAIEVFDGPLDGISSIRFKVFRKSEFEVSTLDKLPAEILKIREEHLQKNSRELLQEEKTLKGYFLYATYHFDAAMKVVDEGTRNEKAFEWRYGLSQSQGRLALIMGDYWIEREINYAVGTQKTEKALVRLDWNKATKKFYFASELAYESLPQ